MSAGRLVLAAALLSVASAACVVAPEPSAVPSRASTPPGPSIVVGGSASPSGVVPSVPPTPTSTIDPTLARGKTVSCGDGIRFPADLLLQSGRAELGTDDAAFQLRVVVGSSPPEGGLPPTGWTRIDAPPSRV